MAKIITDTFFNELLQELYQDIDIQPETTDNMKSLSKTVILSSAKTFTSAYNKLVNEGYFDE